MITFNDIEKEENYAAQLVYMWEIAKENNQDHLMWLFNLEYMSLLKQEEAEANTTAELDAYLDELLAEQHELTKMGE